MSEQPLQDRVRDVQTRLSKSAKAHAAAAAALRPLGVADAYEDLGKLDKLLDRVGDKLPEALAGDPEIRALLDAIRAWREAAGERMRHELGRELRARCEAAGIGFRVVSREDPVEVRLEPFGVVLDFRRGRAEFRFARESVGSCAADPDAILDAHARLHRALETPFRAEAFFDSCVRAWRAARAARRIEGERVELLDFLPYLAVELQSARFRGDPAAANFKGYSRARFAYDVLRLRRERMLARDGKRLNFGVATGTTASEKKRVLYLEDGSGNGEYKLTVFFTRTEEHR